MNRIIVAGARGFFGSAVVRILRARGAAPLAASRRDGADLRIDVEDRASIRAALRPGDVLVDATAPFHARTTRLVEEAVAIGADVIDLCDSLRYARRVAAVDADARARGVRLLNACSSVSVLSALAVRRSGVVQPAAVHGFLVPATRHTANRGVAEAFLASVGEWIDVWRGGEWRRVRGWTESRAFAALGRGRLIETADALTLPRVWPSLRDVDFWVDPNIRGAGLPLAIAARVPGVSRLMATVARHGAGLARWLGRDRGLLACEVRGADGRGGATITLSGGESFLMAALPAALAAARLAAGAPCAAGLVPVDRHVPEEDLLEALRHHGIEIEPRESIGPGRSRR